MSTPFSRALGVVSSRMRKIAGVTVVYGRGLDSVNITDAVAGASTVIASDGDGAEIRVRIRDWLIDPSVLILSSVLIEPQRGDRVTVIEAGRVNVYEVLDLSGEPCARLSEDGSTWRIHTKLISSEAGT